MIAYINVLKNKEMKKGQFLVFTFYEFKENLLKTLLNLEYLSPFHWFQD